MRGCSCAEKGTHYNYNQTTMNNRYIDEFIRDSRAPDMLRWKLFPNAKEITESFSIYAIVRDVLGLDLADPTIAMLCVGDGRVPRTAATFALRSAWTCFSVDPAMKVRWGASFGLSTTIIPRLHAYRAKVLDVGGWYPDERHVRAFSQCVVVAVHSHASLRASVRVAQLLAPRVSVVSMPCCFKDDMDNADLIYDDMGVLSPHRRVYVWKDVA